MIHADALHTAALAPLERWLTAPRVHCLPVPADAAPAPALSFEFFPPRTEALEAQFWACITPARPARAALRLGHLRRRRHGAGPHPRHRHAARRAKPRCRRRRT